MAIINPDFLAYEATIGELYGRKLIDAPRQSNIASDAMRVGTISRKEALAMDFRENLGLTAKYILNISLLPFQLVILNELWTKRFPLMTISRGGGKTFILAVYACLRALIDQGSKVVLVGANFRQSKLIFEEIERI